MCFLKWKIIGNCNFAVVNGILSSRPFDPRAAGIPAETSWRSLFCVRVGRPLSLVTICFRFRLHATILSRTSLTPSRGHRCDPDAKTLSLVGDKFTMHEVKLVADYTVFNWKGSRYASGVTPCPILKNLSTLKGVINQLRFAEVAPWVGCRFSGHGMYWRLAFATRNYKYHDNYFSRSFIANSM